MKRILLAIDVEHKDQQSLHFGCYLSQLTGSPLTGIFLDELYHESHPGVRTAYGGVFVETIDTRQEVSAKNKRIEHSISYFKTTCDSRMVAYGIIQAQGDDPFRALNNEAAYADLLVLGPDLFSSSPLQRPSAFVSKVLSGVVCQVIISPADPGAVREIVFAYDGQLTSIFAIKQFTYLFPELREKPVYVIAAGVQHGDIAGHKEHLTRYLGMHYDKVIWEELPGDPGDELFHRLLRTKEAIIVMGAYGRSTLSRLWHRSTAEPIIQIHASPVFIAHP